jgi:hypothetical protein
VECACYSVCSCMCIFCKSLFSFCTSYLLAIVLYALLRFKDSNYHFGIFKLFFSCQILILSTLSRQYLFISLSLSEKWDSSFSRRNQIRPKWPFRDKCKHMSVWYRKMASNQQLSIYLWSNSLVDRTINQWVQFW